MEDTLLGGTRPRLLRRLVDDEAPYEGYVVAGDEPACVVAVDAFDADPAWRAAGDGHLWAPIDLAQGPDGPCVVLPLLAGRLGACAAAQREAGAAVTVAVSMLRAAREADALAAEEGSWWVSAAGRPVLALRGGASWRARADPIMAALAVRFPALGAELERARSCLRSSAVLRRDFDACEQALFAAAVPAPMQLAGESPVSPPAVATLQRSARTGDGAASDAGGTGQLSRRARRAVTPRTAGARAVVPVRERVAELTSVLVDAAWAEHVRAVLPARRAQQSGATARRGATRRRAPMLAGAAVAAVVLTAGVLWPVDEAPVAAGVNDAPASGGSSSAAAPAPSPAVTSERTAAPEEGGDEAAMVAAVLERIRACADGGCDGFEAPPAAPPEGAAARSDAQGAVVDTYGGVSVVRVEADGEQPQIVVVVRADDEWLVREVYDLTDQPF